MFLNIVTADGAAENAVIREMKARAAGARGDIEQIVRGVMADVQQRGWDAVVEYAERFDGKAPYIVEPKVLDDAYNACAPKLIAALEKAAANIRDYHEQMLVKTWEWNRSGGETLGQTVRGLSRVGIYVPGGTAAYPSSVLMNAIPAKIAGVGELIMVTPPNKNGGANPDILAAAAIAGVDRVFLTGGAQAVAALAYGTQTIPQVDKIVGPGNIYVATAKKLLYGQVDIDMIAGPSEILVVADDTADPVYLAADLMSQAEHDRLASAILLCTSEKIAQKTIEEIERQSLSLSRREMILDSLENFGAVIVCRDFEQMVQLANEIAPEHLEVMVQNPLETVGRFDNAGSVFLGQYSPEPLGDYFAGPNHVLPTSGTARFFSPLSVDSFIKRSSFIYYPKDALCCAAKDIVTIAQKEGLTAHANAIAVRF